MTPPTARADSTTRSSPMLTPLSVYVGCYCMLIVDGDAGVKVWEGERQDTRGLCRCSRLMS